MGTRKQTQQEPVGHSMSSTHLLPDDHWGHPAAQRQAALKERAAFGALALLALSPFSTGMGTTPPAAAELLGLLAPSPAPYQ